MSNTNKRGNSADHSASSADVTTSVNDAQRVQMRLATEALCAVFRGFENMRKVQEHAAHRALTHHASAVERLKGPCELADLLSIQSDLLKFDFESATQYWLGLWMGSIRMQNELSNCGLHLMEEDSLRQATDAWQRMPLFQMSGYEHSASPG